MTLNTSRVAITKARRARVAQLRLRGMTQRQIQHAIAHPPGQIAPLLNPGKDGEPDTPFSLGTINSDVKALEKEWQAESAKDTAKHRARLLAETQELKRAAWAKGDLHHVLAAIEKESKLKGADAPQRQEITGKDGQPLGPTIVMLPAVEDGNV